MRATDNAAGLESLDAMIARVRSYGRGMGEKVARAAAPLIEAAAKKTAAAGTTPDGVAWKPKKDGGRPLEHAAEHLSAKAVGASVVLTLSGKAEVVHNFGNEKDPKRQILPSGGGPLPKGIEAAARKAAISVFQRGAP
jgi:hypothetical protein